jgi:hypothetical protein
VLEFDLESRLEPKCWRIGVWVWAHIIGVGFTVMSVGVFDLEVVEYPYTLRIGVWVWAHILESFF